MKGLERKLEQYSSLTVEQESKTMMTKQEKIQTILRSEVIQWKTMTREQLLNNLVCLESDILEGLDNHSLDDLIEGVDFAEVWGQPV